MAEYLILIYGREAEMAAEQAQELMHLHDNFTHQVEALGGRIVGGEALQSTTTATSIRGDVVTDGPFVETKEALGGYYVIEAADLDQALKIGQACPAPDGGVEVRPIMKFE